MFDWKLQREKKLILVTRAEFEQWYPKKKYLSIREKNAAISPQLSFK